MWRLNIMMNVGTQIVMYCGFLFQLSQEKTCLLFWADQFYWERHVSLYIFDIHIEFDARRKMTAISHYKKALISFKISCISFESLRILYRFRSKWLNFCCELNWFFFFINTKDLHNCCALGRTWCGVSPTCTTGTCQTRGWRCSPSSGFSSWWCSCAPGPWGARCVRTAWCQVGGSAGSCPRA